MRKHRLPKRARARWLENAPAFICDCFDSRNEGERYTVFFTGKEWAAGREGWVAFLGMSDGPEHPQGVSLMGEMQLWEFSQYRQRYARERVRWLDLPAHIREHVIARDEQASLPEEEVSPIAWMTAAPA
jgi:hypothetical protein